jgi:beta-glucanase (GH16 family)
MTSGRKPKPRHAAGRKGPVPRPGRPRLEPATHTLRSKPKPRHAAGRGGPGLWIQLLPVIFAVLLASALVTVLVVGFQSTGPNGGAGDHRDRAVVQTPEPISPDVVPVRAPPVALIPRGSSAYSIVTSDGGVYTFGGAPFYGAPSHPAEPIVGAVATASGNGYWLVDSNGGVFGFGDALFYGSTAGEHLNAPIVGIAATPSGDGYWLVSADGGVFGFGDARFYGSMADQHLSAPIVGIAATPSGDGYWLVGFTGSVYAFGDAVFHGSQGDQRLSTLIVGMSIGASGYRLMGLDGDVFSFGAPTFGSMAGRNISAGIRTVATTKSGNGYWLLGLDGAVYSFGDATYAGRTTEVSPAAPDSRPSTPSPGSTTSPGSTPSPGSTSTPGSTGAPTSPTSPSGVFSAAGQLTTPPGYSANELIWQDNFSGTTLDASKWNEFMTSIASNGQPWNEVSVNGTTYSAIAPPNSVNAEVDSPNLVSVDNGLSLGATPGSPVPGYSYTGSVVDTYGKFAWSGGYFQAQVKMPDVSSGYWPAIWFLPAAGAGTGGDAGEFDLQEGGMLGAAPINSILQSTLRSAAGPSSQQANAGVDLSAGFHTFGAQYVPGQSITVYFDGRQVAQFTQDVPTWPLQLIMCLAVGSSQSSSYHTTGSPAASAMDVSEIQFYR